MNLLPQLHLFVFVSPFTILILTACSVLVWRNRQKSQTSLSLFWFLIASIGILLFNTLELIARTEFLTVLMSRIMHIFFSSIAVLWLLFALQYTGRSRLVKARNILLLSIIPIINLSVLYTNDLHSSFWLEMSFIQAGPYLLFKVTHGFLFYVAASYNYILMLAGVILIISEYKKNFKLHRRQAGLTAIGALIPIVFNIVYIGNLIPGLVKDYTPFSFFLSGLIFTISLFRYRLHDLLPLARTTIVENLSDGIIVLDTRGRILDINPSARQITGLTEENIGQIFTVFEFMWNDFYKSIPIQSLISEETGGIPSTSELLEITKRNGKETLYYQRELTPMHSDEKISGYIITLKNITEQTRLLKKVERLASVDGLTGMLNRRTFMEQCEKVINSCKELGNPLSFAVLDLDFFKDVNDKFGHQKGDEVLKRTAEIIQSNIREVDYAGRFGGDEFTIIFPDCNKQQAESSCNRLRKLIEAQQIGTDENIRMTTSIGVYTSLDPRVETAETVFNNADKALYKAKADGRNQISQG